MDPGETAAELNISLAVPDLGVFPAAKSLALLISTKLLDADSLPLLVQESSAGLWGVS